MKLLKLLLIAYFALLGFSPSLNTVHGEVHPPPVEKNKPFEKRKSKQKLRKKLRQQFKNKQEQSRGVVALILVILAFLLVFAGAIIFGLGVSHLILWVLGLSMVGVGNLMGLILVIIRVLAFSEDSDNLEIGAISIYILAMIAVNFIIGLSFLIWGVVILFPVAWILGIILLALALLYFIFVLLAVINRPEETPPVEQKERLFKT